MPSIFTKIINHEIPAHIVAENDDYLAFLDINPLIEGHVLVIPKKEVDYLFDLDDDTLAGINLFCKKVARGIEKAIPCLRVGVAVVGLEVPHAHIHLIPLNSMDDINFSRRKLTPSHEELGRTCEKIKSQI